MANFLFSYTLKLFLLFILCSVSACVPTQRIIDSEIKTIPIYPIQPVPELLLLINTYDLSGEMLRDKKEELFLELADSTLAEMSRQIESRGAITTKVLFGISTTPIADDMRPLLTGYVASHAIAITCYDVSFVQTEEVTTEDDGYKSKEAYYDIVAEINYTLYDQKGPLKDLQIAASMYHSSRTVLLGLLAAGPNIVNNKQDALTVTKDNVEKYLNFFLPGTATRSRIIYVSAELAKVNEAYLRGDYETVLKESLLYINDDNDKLAAKANLNCAVLLEHQQKSSAARSYLEKSLQRHPLRQAMLMKPDYGMQ